MLPCLWRVAAELVDCWQDAIPACASPFGVAGLQVLHGLLGFGALEMPFLQDSAQLQVPVPVH